MARFETRLSTGFAAGALGGLVNALVVWLFGYLGITTALHVSIAPPLTPGMIYARVVWGGLWGFLLLAPWLTRSVFRRGLVLSLGPTLVQLFVVFPLKAHKGLLGLDLGAVTPVFVVFFNAVWGWTAVIWSRRS